MRLILMIFGITLTGWAIRYGYRYFVLLLLKRNGLNADAIILGVQETGKATDHQSHVLLQIQVNPVQGKNFVIEMKRTLSGDELKQFLPGSKLKVRYNPHNHRQVILY